MTKLAIIMFTFVVFNPLLMMSERLAHNVIPGVNDLYDMLIDFRVHSSIIFNLK